VPDSHPIGANRLGAHLTRARHFAPRLPPDAATPPEAPSTRPRASDAALPPPAQPPRTQPPPAPSRPVGPSARGPISILVPAGNGGVLAGDPPRRQPSQPPSDAAVGATPPPLAAPPPLAGTSAAAPRVEAPPGPRSPAGPTSPLDLPWAATAARAPGQNPQPEPPAPPGEVEITVLGRPAVSAPGPVPADRLDELTELVIYLALGPTGPSMHALATTLWSGEVGYDVVAEAVGLARAWLGSDARGRPRLYLDADGRPRLDPGVRCDWRLFTAWTRRAGPAAGGARGESRPAGAENGPDPAASLAAALRLVTGPVLTDLPAGRYRWLAATGVDARIRAAVVDTAHRLASRTLDTGDAATAMAACRTGLRAVPTAEILWRDLLRTVAARGDQHALQAVAAEMYRNLPPATEADRERAAGGRARMEVYAEHETNELVRSLIPRYRPSR
jgi:hypothetical protein